MEVIFIKRYVVEFGYGVDLHGQDVNKAAQKAVKDAISHKAWSFNSKRWGVFSCGWVCRQDIKS